MLGAGGVPDREDSMRQVFTGGRLWIAMLLVALCLTPPRLAQADLAEAVIALLQQTVVIIDTDDGFGTGFVASADGIVLTNAHVVAGDSMLLTFADGRTETARFIGFERHGHDLAALRLSGETPRPWLPLADAAPLRIGVNVYAAGNPYPTFPVTVSGGIIASVSERLHVLLIDAPIASGSSGGPVVTASGEVLGIVTSQLLDYSESGMGAAAFGSGFNTALDVHRLAAFLADVRRGDVTQVRQANLEWLTLPLPHLVVPVDQAGRLGAESDRMLEDRSFVDGYTIDLESGQVVTIDLFSDEFDAYLQLIDPHGDVLARNDDADETTTDARITLSVERSGRYAVLANALLARETGAYLLRVRAQTFGPPEVVAGSLSAGRGRAAAAEVDWHREIRGRAGTTVAIGMHSDELDSYLELLDARGQVIAANDDYVPGSFDARIVHRFADDGRYTIRATSFTRSATGAFELRIEWAQE
jgi:S1-C subfamily serine protease